MFVINHKNLCLSFVVKISHLHLQLEKPNKLINVNLRRVTLEKCFNNFTRLTSLFYS